MVLVVFAGEFVVDMGFAGASNAMEEVSGGFGGFDVS